MRLDIGLVLWGFVIDVKIISWHWTRRKPKKLFSILGQIGRLSNLLLSVVMKSKWWQSINTLRRILKVNWTEVQILMRYELRSINGSFSQENWNHLISCCSFVRVLYILSCRFVVLHGSMVSLLLISIRITKIASRVIGVDILDIKSMCKTALDPKTENHCARWCSPTQIFHSSY